MDQNDKPGRGCLTGIIVFVVLVLLLLLISSSGMLESDYERAGKEFETWINEDPRTWSDTERQYFEDFWEWSNNN